MAAYQSSAGGDIGSLLRLIQEEKSQSILQAPPETDPNSPIREQIQEPVLTPEAPDSSRQVSLRPEGEGSVVSPVESLQAGGQAPVGPTSPVSPVSPGGVTPDGGVVAPTRPQPAFSSMGEPGMAGGGQPSPVSANMSRAAGPSVSKPSMPSIGTRISGPSASYSKSSQPAFKGYYAPSNTPTNSTRQSTPKQSSFSWAPALTTVNKVATKILPAFAESFLGRALKIPFGMVDYKGLQRSQGQRNSKRG